MSKISEAFKRFTGQGGAANDNLRILADESLIIERSQRAGPVIRSLLKHAGGYPCTLLPNSLAIAIRAWLKSIMLIYQQIM